MLCDVAPVDHVFPLAAEEVKVIEFPEQKVVAPLAEIVGVDGFEFTVTTVAVEEDEHPLEVTITL